MTVSIQFFFNYPTPRIFEEVNWLRKTETQVILGIGRDYPGPSNYQVLQIKDISSLQVT